MRRFGEKLLDMLAKRNWSQAVLARESGLNATTLSRAINGQTGGRLYADQVLQLAKVLGCSTDYLIDDDVSEPARGGPELTQDQQLVLRLAEVLGTERALRRLADPQELRTLGHRD